MDGSIAELTLRLRALDARADTPVPGDDLALQVVQEMGST